MRASTQCVWVGLALLLLPAGAGVCDETASVSVSSTPAGATVLLDNRFAGVTPLTVTGVAYGPHLLTVGRYRYASQTQALQVDQPEVKVAVTLKALGRGRLKVITTPEEADVFVNGSPRGKTPLTLEDLAPGTYQVRIEAEGCPAIQESVEVEADKEAKLERTLESKSESYLLAEIEKDPTRVANYYDLAHHYILAQQYEKAFGAFAKGFDACVSPKLVTSEQRRLYDEFERVWDGQYNFADDAVRENLHPRLISELQKAIPRKPRNVLTYWQLGQFYEKTKEWQKAGDVYEQGFQAVKSPRAKLYLAHYVASARYHQGVELEQAKKPDEALAIYEALLKEHPKAYYSRSALQRMIGISQEKQDVGRVIELKKQYLALFPESSYSANMMAEIAGLYSNRLKEYDKAIETYRQLITTYGAKAPSECQSAQMSIASIYRYYLKDIPAAIREYEKFLADYPRAPGAPNALGALHEIYRQLSIGKNAQPDAKDKDEAVCKRILAEYPWSAEAAVVDTDPANRKLRQEAQLAYRDAAALAASDPKKAIAGYEEVVKKYPKLPQALYAQEQIISLWENRLKEPEKANAERERFLTLFPESPQCPNMLYHLGYAKAYGAKQFDAGLADFRRLVKQYPNSALAPTAQYYIARLYGFTGGHYDREKYIEENRRLIQMYPWSEQCAAAQVAIGLNFYYQTQPGDKELAQKELLKVVENYPYSDEAMETEYYLDLVDAGLQLDENKLALGGG